MPFGMQPTSLSHVSGRCAVEGGPNGRLLCRVHEALRPLKTRPIIVCGLLSMRFPPEFCTLVLFARRQHPGGRLRPRMLLPVRHPPGYDLQPFEVSREYHPGIEPQ
jgi:hypothetical protein